jgi:hypothetical protein
MKRSSVNGFKDHQVHRRGIRKDVLARHNCDTCTILTVGYHGLIESFVIVHGPRGSGKTELVDEVIKEKKHKVIRCDELANAKSDPIPTPRGSGERKREADSGRSSAMSKKQINMGLSSEYLLLVCAPSILPGGSSPVFFPALLCRPERVAREKVFDESSRRGGKLFRICHHSCYPWHASTSHINYICPSTISPSLLSFPPLSSASF